MAEQLELIPDATAASNASEPQQLKAGKDKGETVDSVKQDVREQLADDYPPEATAWVDDVPWEGPKTVPLVDLDFSNEKKWRASAEPEKIHKFAKKIQKGKLKPIIAVKAPQRNKLIIVDGHHRALAYRALGRDAMAYVATVPQEKGEWLAMHNSQTHGPSTMSAFDSSLQQMLSLASGEDCQLPQSLDVGAADVHVPGAVGGQKNELYVSAKKRKSMPAGQFGDPENKAYPIHDAAHVRNAAARLEQQKGSMSPDKYRKIRARIAAAAKRFGIKSQYNKPKTKANLGGYRISLRHPGGGSTVIQHRMNALTAAWFPDTRQLLTYIPIDKTEALAEPQVDEQGNKRIWVQVARTGAWTGHHQGAFSITPQTLDQIVDNFHSQRFGRIQWDFDHASAMPATSGSRPQNGAPAQGWIYDFRHDGEKLYALTEWLPLARQYIQNDQYAGVSPVIDWHFADRVTDKDIGPTITSVALTNLPFLTDMDRPLAASVQGIANAQRGAMPLAEVDPKTQQFSLPGTTQDPYCYYSDADMLSQLKSVFGLHELANAADCKGALSNLCYHLDAVDGDGSAHHEGVQIGNYLGKLREMVSGGSSMSATQLVQFLDGILDAYMAANGIPDPDDDLNGLSLTAAPEATPAVETPPAATVATTEGATMAEPVAAPAAAAAPVVTAASVDATPAVATEPAPAAAAAPASTSADAAAAPATPDVSILTLQLHQSGLDNDALRARIAELEANQRQSEEQTLTAAVDVAFETYKDSKKLTPEMRPHMLSMAQKDRAAFDVMFPPVDPDKRHLLSNLTGGGASNPHNPGARTAADTSQTAPENPAVAEARSIIALGLNGLADQLEAEGIPFASAQIKADQKLREARQVLSTTTL